MSAFGILTEQEFEIAAKEVVYALVMEAGIQMQRKLMEAGFVMTAELNNSINTAMQVQRSNLYAEFTIGFKGYGRFKDMRKLLFTKMPPVDVLQKYVEYIGLDKFSYVPGYLKDAKRRVEIPETRAANRIAWGIAVSRVQTGVMRQGKRNAFYNPVRGRLIFELRDAMMEFIPAAIMARVKGAFESMGDDEEIRYHHRSAWHLLKGHSRFQWPG